MHLKLFFLQTEHEPQVWGWEGCDWAVTMRDQIQQHANTPYEMTDDPEQADIIVFWEPHQRSQVIRIPRLRAHQLVQRFPNKVFVVSVEDSPLGLLSGLYASLPASRYHPHRHRTTLYYRTHNPYLRSLRAGRRVSSPPYLASFTGTILSHDLRYWLFEMADSFAQHDILLKATPFSRFAITQDPELKPQHLEFIDTILDAKFSLCPRGNGAGTYRLQESLALGRAPVIISDNWVPVADLDWERFAIFVAEESLPELPAILREHEPRWEEMGAIARQTYESHFSQEVFALRAVEQIVAIRNVRTHDERHFFSRWDQVLAEAERGTGQ